METQKVKQLIFGKPFPTSMAIHERLDKVRGLALFASDPISSNAYATEAIMGVLIVLGSPGLGLTIPIAIAIAMLVLIVVFSYIQTILHYPGGGGSYIVAKDNLGTLPSLIAAGALLTDYSLTVAVSVSAGIRAITSAFPHLENYQVIFAILTIVILTWLNLRGVRESGTVFAIPTYAFIVGILLMIGIGLVRYFGLFNAAPIVINPVSPLEGLSTVSKFGYIWLLLRAFAAGCTALTGIEAISDGVQAFKAPETVNAAKTMVAMGVIAMSLFLGISFLATQLHLIPTHTESLLSQLTRTVTGGGILYYWIQFFTMMILVLAANTGFQDFPRLSYFLARDKFMPRWMTNQGDRLVFNGGVITLAVISIAITTLFQANEIAMLPLYAIGVMVSFTISQAGMVVLMGKVAKLKPGEVLETSETHLHHEKGWQWKRVVNALGMVTTFIVFIILVVTKFIDGAWIVVITIPMIIWGFYTIRHHYENVSVSLSTKGLKEDNLMKVAEVVLLPIGDVHQGTLRALQYAKLISNDVRAIHISTSEKEKERLMERWNRFPEITRNVNLICIDHDFRDVLDPLISYLTTVKQEEFPNQIITVVLPEILTPSLATRALHNQTATLLRSHLLQNPDIIIIEIPFHIRSKGKSLHAVGLSEPEIQIPSPGAGVDKSSPPE